MTQPNHVEPRLHEPGPMDGLDQLTPAQQAQLQAIVAQAVTIANRHQSQTEPARQGERPARTDPGVWIAVIMLALVTAMAVVAIVAVFGLAVLG